MYVCLRAFITRCFYSLSSEECAPIVQTKKMCLYSLACYRIMSVSVLDHKVTVAESSTVLEHKQQSCVVQNWKCGRLALVDRHEQQSVDGDDLY